MKTISNILTFLITASLFTACGTDDSPLNLDTFVKTGTLVYEFDTLQRTDVRAIDLATGVRWVVQTNVTLRSPAQGSRIAVSGPSEMNERPNEIYVIDVETGSTIRSYRTAFGTDVETSSVALSPDGETLIYTGIEELVPGLVERRLVIQQLKHRDSVTLVPIGSSHSTTARFSPDGSRIAFFDREFGNCCEGNLNVVNSDGTNLKTILTATVGVDEFLATVEWSPDGKQLLYSFSEFGGVRIINADGSSPQTVDFGLLPTWSPDGSRILYTLREGDGDFRLVTTKPDGTNLKYLTSDPAAYAAWSPRGSMVAYSQSGKNINGWPTTPATPYILIQDLTSGTIIDSIESAGLYTCWVE